MKLSSFVKKTIAVIEDLETGHPKSQSTKGGSHSNVHPEKPRDPRVEEKLTHFRHYVGIHNDPDLSSGRPSTNIGIYQRLVKAEKSYGKQYKTYSILINSALGLQIVFAAALTALGAGNGPRSAVTVFGAINTVLAGFLTYLKGSGLPNRFKYYENELIKVREYIEQREREFARGDTDLDLKEEVTTIENMYETVKRDIEINTPEAYVSISNATARDGRYPQPSLGTRKHFDDRTNEYDEKMGNPKGVLDSLQHSVDSRLYDTQASLESRINDMRRLESEVSQTCLDAESRITSARDGLNSQYQQTRDGVTSQYQHARQDVESQMQRTRSGLDNELQHTQADISQQVGQTRTAFGNQYDQARLATQSQLENTRRNIESRVQETETQVENTSYSLASRIQDTQRDVSAQVEQTRHGLETSLQDTQRDVTSHVDAKVQEVQDQVKEQEEKFMGIAESVAQTVLSVTQKMHDQR